MKTRNMVLCALFAAQMAICAWISIPTGSVSFTLQTFALFFTLSVLGGKLGSVTVLIYLALGAVGLPVFSGFQGGIGALFGPSGGFLLGFMLTSLLYWLIISLLGSRACIKITALCIGLLCCYLCGWLWYCRFAPVNFFLWCLPYLLPDALKLILALFLSKRLKAVI